MTAHYVTGPSQCEHLHKCCHNNHTTHQEREATTFTNSVFNKENCHHHIRLGFIFLSVHVSRCQYLRPSLSDEDSVLRLGGPPAVLGQVGPAVLQHPHLRSHDELNRETGDDILTYPPVPLSYDRLNSEHHARHHLQRVIVEAVVDVRGAVKKATDT